MKKYLYTSIGILSVLCMTACGSKDAKMEIKPGTYQIEGTDSQIILGENNKITVRNYDFSELEKASYEDYLIARENKELSEGETINSEKEQKIRDDIDLAGQFLDKENTYTQEEEDGYIGIYVPVENCDLYFYAQFCPSDDTITFDDKIFKFTKN